MPLLHTRGATLVSLGHLESSINFLEQKREQKYGMEHAPAGLLGAHFRRQRDHGLRRVEECLARLVHRLIALRTCGLLSHRLHGFAQLLRGRLQLLDGLGVIGRR